jgi:mannose-6-phosphate isomerase-like protein (cupin superfamily)
LRDAIGTYFAAWNEHDLERCRELLEQCVIGDVELVHPTFGRAHGIDPLIEWIGRYQSGMPGTTIVLASGIDAHNDLARYAWEVLDEHGEQRMAGIDVVEFAADGRLRRVVLFHGPLQPAEQEPGSTSSETNEELGVITLGAVTIRYVHANALSPYSLLEWSAPTGTPSPPVHVHHHTDEGFYVTAGSYAFELDGERILAPAGSHVLVPKGRAHTFWNAGKETAVCLILLAPPGFEAYFRELSEGLARTRSDDEAIELRHRLSATYDIEEVGPPVQAP